MAIKSVLTALISGNWGDVTSPKRLPNKDREVGNKIVDEIYPTPIYDTQLTTNVFTKESDNFIYVLRTSKSGRNVNLSGRFINITGVSIDSQTLCDITNSEFNNYVYPREQTFIAHSLTGQSVLITVHENSFNIIGIMPHDVSFYFNFTYQVAN